jgi:Radical SAM superfamily
MKVLRETTTTCPVCLERLPGQVTVRDGKFWLERTCPKHGHTAALLSNHADYMADLHAFYFDLMRVSLPQRDFILRTTDRCNLECPICLASANERALPDLPMEQLRDFVRTRRRHKIDLMGCEPTVREDLPEMIRVVAESGNYASLHTNGVKLADREYLRTLKEAGLSEVHYGLDGFDDKIYSAIRGEPLLENKYAGLKNLEALDMATDLKCTVARGVNDDALGEVFDYGVAHDYVREIFFLGTRLLGRQRDGDEGRILAPDELLDFLEEQTGGRINRDDVRVFQKLYFALLYISRLRKCFYNQHYLLVREAGGGYRTIFEVIKKAGLDAKLETFRHETKGGTRRWWPALKLGVRLIPNFLSWRAMRFAWDAMTLKTLLWAGFDLSRIPRRNVLIGFITACDGLIWDEAVASNCGKGDIAVDIGHHDSGATANIDRDRRIYCQPEWETRHR